MALTPKSLVRIAQTALAANSVTSLFFYVTNDPAATVETAGYFNDIRNRLKKGDVILVSLDLDGTSALRTYVVQSSPGTGNVTITLGTATAAA